MKPWPLMLATLAMMSTAGAQELGAEAQPQQEEAQTIVCRVSASDLTDRVRQNLVHINLTNIRPMKSEVARLGLYSNTATNRVADFTAMYGELTLSGAAFFNERALSTAPVVHRNGQPMKPNSHAITVGLGLGMMWVDLETLKLTCGELLPDEKIRLPDGRVV